MNQDECRIFPSLVEDIYQIRATIRYDIKLAETRLHQRLVLDPGGAANNQQATDCCVIILQLYVKLLAAFSGVSTGVAREWVMENDRAVCYCKIQELKSRLCSAISLQQKVLAVHELIFYYENLVSLLSATQYPEEICPASKVSKALHELLHAQSPENWLAAVVDFAKDTGHNTERHHAQLLQLSDKELLSLYDAFVQEDYVALINCLFFYKLYPERLYSQFIHPEKLLSVKIRLGMLHAFIEFVHHSAILILGQRGIHAEKDYLFHGDEIPQGIGVEEEHKFQEMIAMAVKNWRLTQLFYPDEVKASDKINEIARAYKFWFNPDRLIDAVMSFRTELTGSNAYNAEDDSYFASQMHLLYQPVSTSQCIDLYGYFSNKDSCYLMRTLEASFEGEEIAALPVLTVSEKMAIRQVYMNLDCVMNALRDELQHRHISTAPYPRSHHSKEVLPGRRNLQAVRRILDIYLDKQIERNLVLEKLFSEIEK